MGQDDEIKTMNEEAAINAAFQDILDIYLASQHRKKVELITKAFNFARQAHKGVRRHSGEPYIMHPLAVARIVCAEIGLGSTSICAALLHDVVEDTDYTVEDIRNLFGEKISKAQRLSNWEIDNLSEAQKQYAATDAWACVRLYEEIERMKKEGYELITTKHEENHTTQG
jgi:(p)ppGpp synthase/HD superfamily hydrolase